MIRGGHPASIPLHSDLFADAHRFGVHAAAEGLSDAALGDHRLAGPHVRMLAEQAVRSATPFLRAPLLSRIAEVLLLHGERDKACGHCRMPWPCPTVAALTR